MISLGLAAKLRLEALNDAVRCCEEARSTKTANLPGSITEGYRLGTKAVEERIKLIISATEAIWKDELDAIHDDPDDGEDVEADPDPGHGRG